MLHDFRQFKRFLNACRLCSQTNTVRTINFIVAMSVTWKCSFHAGLRANYRGIYVKSCFSTWPALHFKPETHNLRKLNTCGHCFNNCVTTHVVYIPMKLNNSLLLNGSASQSKRPREVSEKSTMQIVSNN